MIVLGVDPGSLRTGFGVIETDGRRVRVIASGVLAPSRRASLESRLRAIHEGVRDVIARHAPDLMAVEDLFHATNARSALVLGHVRGVVLLAGAEGGLPVEAYPPATVKAQVTGSGRADKRQVAYMVCRHLGLPGDGKAGDAADALAVALCAAQLAGPSALTVRTTAAARSAR